MPTTPQTGSHFTSGEMLRAIADGDSGSFAMADGVAASAGRRAEFIDGLSEVAAEIERFRLLGQASCDGFSREDGTESESVRASVIGGAFILGFLAPILVHAASLGLGAASKILLLSASVAPMILSR